MFNIDPDALAAAAQVLTHLKEHNAGMVKLRTVVYDVGPWYGPRHRVTVKGDRSASSRCLSVTKIERLP